MSDFQRTVQEITACVKSRTPLIVVMTCERDRAESALKVVSVQNQNTVWLDPHFSFYFSAADQIEVFAVKFKLAALIFRLYGNHAVFLHM